MNSMLSTKALTPYGGRLRQYTLSAYHTNETHPELAERWFWRDDECLTQPASWLLEGCVSCIADFPFEGHEADEAQSDF